MQQRFSLLSKPAILRHKEEGNIVIDPFDKRNLGTVSCDVTLGPYYFRESHPAGGPGFYNPWSPDDVFEKWGEPRRAEQAAKFTIRTGLPLKNIWPDDRVIWIAPGETILCHTQEFIGGRRCVTTLMKARSSVGKNFIEVCKCAGWGDVGYINRWTMEVTSNSRFHHQPLVVGRRVAQIAFFEVQGLEEDYVSSGGKYQHSQDLDELRRSWSPEMMLPRMDRDFEVDKEAIEKAWEDWFAKTSSWRGKK